MRLLLFLFLGLLLGILVPLSECASSATSFCKCTCKGNSTIIALDPKPSSSPVLKGPLLAARDTNQEGDDDVGLESNKKAGAEQGRDTIKRGSTCSDCNRKFCLDYNLPGCKGVKEEEVFTTCFQRDSLKDELVVFIFIIATAGLLIWGLLRPYADRWITRAQDQRSYAPLSPDDDRQANTG